jgi:hypothetical protein
MFPILEFCRVYNEAVCEGKSIARARLHGKAGLLGLVHSTWTIETAARTLHQTEAVCVGRKTVFRIQKDHHIEGVLGVRSLAVRMIVIHLAALSMGL